MSETIPQTTAMMTCCNRQTSAVRRPSAVARLFFGHSVAALLLIVYVHIHEYFWSNTCGFVKKKISREFNLVKKLLYESDEILNSWRKFPAMQYIVKKNISSHLQTTEKGDR